MANLLRMFQGKKAPHPPKRDYTDKQGSERRSKGSGAEDEASAAAALGSIGAGAGGGMGGQSETSPRGSSPTPHGANLDRFRFGSQTSYGTGTVDLKSCGAGSGPGPGGSSSAAGGPMMMMGGTGTRPGHGHGGVGGVGLGGGDGMLDTRRRNDSGGGPKSPNTKTPIVLDDYSDPQDVLKAAVDSGILAPRPEGPEPGKPYAEDDYSVPYELVKQMRSGNLPDDGPIPNQPYADDDYSLPYDLVKKSKHHIPEEGWDPNRMAVPEDDYSLPYDVIKQIRKQPKSTNSKMLASSGRHQQQQQHQYEEPPDVSELSRHASGEESSEEGGRPWEEGAGLGRRPEVPPFTNSAEQENGSAVHGGEAAGQPMSPAPDQTPQNDMRPQGEYDNPWEWRSHHQSHQLGRPPPQPDSPAGECKRSRSKSDVAHVGGLGLAAGPGRTSPESDIRPQDDYDQPWEWIQKNRQMSQVLTEKEKQSMVSRSGASTPDNARRGSPRKPSKDLKLELRHKHEVQGEKIDPNLSLDEQSFYHGKLSRVEAEKLLKPCRECSYLVRQSESAQKDYSLSLKSAKGFMHMKIVSYPQGYILGEFSKPFLGIPPMIHYYTTHKLNIRGAEHMALLHPVEYQML